MYGRRGRRFRAMKACGYSYLIKYFCLFILSRICADCVLFQDRLNEGDMILRWVSWTL